MINDNQPDYYRTAFVRNFPTVVAGRRNFVDCCHNCLFADYNFSAGHAYFVACRNHSVGRHN